MHAFRTCLTESLIRKVHCALIRASLTSPLKRMVQQALIHLMQSEKVYTFNENLLKLGSPPLASMCVKWDIIKQLPSEARRPLKSIFIRGIRACCTIRLSGEVKLALIRAQ